MLEESQQCDRLAALLLGATSEGFWGLDKDGLVTYVNPAGAALLGYAGSAELVGLGFLELVHPQCVKNQCQLRQAVQSGLAVRLDDEVLTRADGTSVRIECCCEPLMDAGIRVGTVFTCRDNSSQRKAQVGRQIQFEQAKLHSLFEQAPIPLAILSGPSHQYRFANAIYQDYFLPPGDYLGKTVAELIPDAQEQGFIDLLDAVYSSGQKHLGYEAHFQLLKPGQQPREFYFNFTYEALRNLAGEVEGIMAAISDVTVQVKSREESERFARELANEQRKLIDMIAASPAGIALMRGPDFIFEKANAQWRSFVSEREYIGRPHAEVYPELVGSPVVDYMRETFETGKPFKANELKVKLPGHPEGLAERFYDTVYLRMDDVDGKPYGILCHVLDVTERVMSQARLRESQSDLIDILESMSDAFFSLDRDWNIVRVNANTVKVTGIDRDNQLGKNFWEVFIPSPQARTTQFWTQYHLAMNDRVAVVFEDFYEALGIWMQCRAYPKADGGLAVFYTDVTERRLVESQLAFERHKLEIVFQQTPAAMALWQGHDLVFEKVNPQYQKIFGDRQLVGKPLLEAVPELSGQGFTELLISVLETGIPYVGKEFLAQLMPSKGGMLVDHYYDFSYLRINDSQGLPYGVYDHAVDVTERVQARLRLEASEARLKGNQDQLSRAIEVAKIGFFDWNLQQGRLTFSDQMKKDWGMAEDCSLEEIGRRIHIDDREENSRLANQSLETGEPYRSEYRVVRPDGVVIWVEAQGEVSYDEEDRPVRFLGTAIDISERKRRQHELEAAKTEAERANETKSAFLANMSHEIRTPLGAILGFTELLKGRDLLPDEREQFLEIIIRNGKALTRIIDDILDLAKVESGKLMTEEVEFCFSELLKEVLDLFSENAKSKGVALTLEIADNVPLSISSDPTRLRQILINIVGNAVKFTQQGGIQVQIQASRRDEDLYDFAITVKDNGVGIPGNQREKLFQPFVQADNTATRKFGGTGLGLVLSHRLAVALGGEVILANSDSSGSTFVIRFVARSAQAADGEASVDPDTPAASSMCLSGRHILVAEDSLDNQLLIRNILTKNGARVDTVDDGCEALRLALKNSYEILLMDLQMPVMDGYEATRSLRLAGYTRPIVALTSHAMEEERVRTRAAGCDAHLTKPINQPELVETILRLLDSEPRSKVPQ